MCEKTEQKSWTHWTKLMQENTEDIFPRPVFEKDKVQFQDITVNSHEKSSNLGLTLKDFRLGMYFFHDQLIYKSLSN